MGSPRSETHSIDARAENDLWEVSLTPIWQLNCYAAIASESPPRLLLFCAGIKRFGIMRISPRGPRRAAVSFSVHGKLLPGLLR